MAQCNLTKFSSPDKNVTIVAPFPNRRNPAEKIPDHPIVEELNAEEAKK